MNNLTLGSLFDGSGGFPLGGLISGIQPVWASEIEPFPIRVTTKRMPFMKHYGNISQMDGGKIEPVDIITFGSPCTDMSVAGRRAGLEGQQSVLFYQAIRIIKEMRCATNGRYPRYCVWENVPGAFSSNGGEDFKAVLEAVINVAEPEAQVPMPEKNRWPYADCYMGDGWSVAYRVLDAQYWGVPQRRKRIYLVADFAGRSAFDILFKSEGLSGYSAEGFRAWQRTAGNAADCAGTAGICLNDQGGQRMDVTDDVSATLRAETHHPPCVMESAGFCTEHSSTSRSIGYEEECSPTLRAGTVPAAVYENHSQDTRYTGPLEIAPTVSSTYGMGGNNQPFVVAEDETQFRLTAYGICSKDSNAMKSDNPHSGIYEADTSRTIDANGGNPCCNQGGIAVVAFTQNQRDEVRDLGEQSAVVCANSGTKQQTFVLQGNMIGRSDGNGPQGDGIKEDVGFTLNTVDRHAVYAMTTGNFSQVTEDAAPTLMARDFKDPTAVCYGIGRDTFNQSKNALFSPTFDDELQPTLVAKGPGAIQNGYTVRRLTPTECARLQGFPDWWCDNIGIAEPAKEDIRCWYEVFETHRRITGSSTKPKSLKQIAKWLRDPHSDAAEYKMWGNGVALPCVVFVLSGIVWSARSCGQ